MARKGFKRWWTTLVPTSVERSAYVFIASLGLLVAMWQWRPMPEVVWQVTSPPIALALTALSFLGWLIFFIGNFAINHWKLFGLRHIGDYFHDSVTPEPTPLSYQLGRHLTYLGFIIAVWSTPTMTTGHLLFAFVMSVYILVRAMLKEGDLIDQVGKMAAQAGRLLAQVQQSARPERSEGRAG
jgi:protein-S-isoprenylcysteine O-methyltransferase Ste14